MKKSSKVKIPDNTRCEIEFLFYHKIVTTIEKHSILDSMIINIDQTPLKYVPTSIFTLVEKEAMSVPIKVGSNKKCITGTFSITFSHAFLLM